MNRLPIAGREGRAVAGRSGRAKPRRPAGCLARRKRPPFAGLVLSLVLACVGGPSRAEEPGEPTAGGSAKVLDSNRTLVYIDAGREEGLSEGDIVEVVRDGVVLGTLRVAYLASHRASCTFESGEIPVETGDRVRFVPRKIDSPPAASVPQAAASRRRTGGSPLRRAGLRGRLGLRYLMVRDQSEAMSSLSQPGVDLRVEGESIGGSNVGLSVDVRSQRTYSTYAGGDGIERDRTRVYRMAISWFEPRSGFSLRVGRQYSPTLSSVSVFDGALIDFGGVHWNVGGFSGSEPDPVDFSYSTEIRQHGIYASMHNGAGSSKLWAVTLGTVGSYHEGEIDREFLFVQTRYGGPRISMYLAQEVDYNRGWKTEFEDQTFSPTSTYFNLQWRATRGLRFTAGYDNRRRVRLYRDRITPETEFDDYNRLGARVGWGWNNRHYRVGMDAYSTSGDTIGEGSSYSLYFGATSFTRQQVGVTTRATVYSNARAQGSLYSLGIGTNLGRSVRLLLGGGVREEQLLGAPDLQQQITWLTLDLDFSLGRSWYLLVSGEQNRGENEDNLQVFTSLAYRF